LKAANSTDSHDLMQSQHLHKNERYQLTTDHRD